MLTRFTFGQREKTIHPLVKLTHISRLEVKSAAKAGPSTRTIFALPVYNYETRQIEIIESTEFFRAMSAEGEMNVDLYDYRVSIQFSPLPPGFLVGGRSFPQLIITKLGQTQDATIHTLPSQEELQEFAQKTEIDRENWRSFEASRKKMEH